MDARKLNKIFSWIYPVLSLLVVAGVWAILHAKIGSEYLFPSLGSTLERTVKLVQTKELWTAIGGTMGRAVWSFLVALVLAIVFGIASYLLPPIRKVLSPIVAIMRSAPTVALMVILAFVVKSTEQRPVIVSVTVIFPMLYASTLGALKQIPRSLIEMSVVYEVKPIKRIFGLYVPSVAPTMIAEAGAALSFNVKLIVSAEILAYTSKSLGGLIQTANAYSDMSGLFALTIISIILATALEQIVRLISYLLTKRGGGV